MCSFCPADGAVCGSNHQCPDVACHQCPLHSVGGQWGCTASSFRPSSPTRAVHECHYTEPAHAALLPPHDAFILLPGSCMPGPAAIPPSPMQCLVQHAVLGTACVTCMTPNLSVPYKPLGSWLLAAVGTSSAPGCYVTALAELCACNATEHAY
jgi:hypothetical protein